MCVCVYVCMWHDTIICVPRLSHMSHTHIHTALRTHIIESCRHDAIWMSQGTQILNHLWCMWHDSILCVPFVALFEPADMCDMTHSYEWHDSVICVPSLIHMCDMTHSFVWHDWLRCVTWLVFIYNYVFICAPWHYSRRWWLQGGENS